MALDSFIKNLLMTKSSDLISDTSEYTITYTVSLRDDRYHDQKDVRAMPPSRPTEILLFQLSWNSKLW